ncbi:MAG TPA: glycosyltransferase family 2 protein [Vicinamibacterales bacterium]|jgi:cellulose synthase/poly-beta-1,6-N-acetylglucosamine synthase-like glycosyltransferase
MTTAAVIAFVVLLYVYLGYPLLLRAVVFCRGARRVETGDATPTLSLVISAYNEAEVIRRKLENVLELDYPREQLEVVVVSDASSDGTDDIVAEFRSRGVRLERRPVRKGKTAGLNWTVPRLRGTIVVFSDANTLYAPDALRQIVRGFADPLVGSITGETQYLEGRSAADAGERAYWGYEGRIKRLETAVWSTVGGDGALYAIRRALWRTLPETAINDFLNPLQIVEAGWRAIYMPEARGFEETAGNVKTEWRRRVRIVSRSWRAVWQAKGVLNPFRVGFFAVSVVSHKMLRWLSGLFAGICGAAIVNVARSNRPLLLGALALAAAAVLAALVSVQWRRRLALPFYALVIQIASVVGVVKGMFGVVSGTWTTAPRLVVGEPDVRSGR